MSDITLTVSAPGPTVDLSAVAGTSVSLTVNEGGGGGVSTHAELSDLASSGHPASIIAFTPTGSIAATTVQAAVAEVATDAAAAYQPLDADLTAIAALTSPATTITGAVPKSTVTTAGDLIYGTGNAAVSRLGIGTALQVLRTNAGATAPEWATVSSGAVSVIARTVLADDNSSTVDFTSIPSTYESLMVTWQARSTSSAIWTVLWCRLNNDSTANYEYGYSRSTGGSVAATGATGQTGAYVGLLVDNGGTTGFASYGSLVVPGYARTVFNKGLVGTASAQYGAGAGKASVGDYSATWINTAAVNRITFYPNSLNFVAGTVFTLYGIAGA